MRRARLALLIVPLLGACGGKGTSGEPETLASGDGNFLHLAVDGSGVYWTATGTTGEGKLMHVPLAGGDAKTIVTKLAAPSLIALDADNIYFTDQTSKGGVVYRVSRAGGTPVQLIGALQLAQKQAFSSLLVFGANVFVADNEPVTSGGIVATVPVGGGTIKQIATQQADPRSLSSDKLNVYWAQTGAGKIEKIDQGLAQKVTDLATEQDSPHGVGVDTIDGFVYWSTTSGVGAQATLVRVNITGGTPQKMTDGLTIGVSGTIRVDPSGIYFIAFDGTDYEIQHVPLSGGAPGTLGKGSAVAVFDLATYGNKVYWIESDGQKSYVKWIDK